ncbi:MAG TPA: lyase family protein [Planctomycetota bacterium]|nr:lyase family protein [Planctomycetota bacterium]
MSRLWEKGEKLDPFILDYTTGDDPVVDLSLVEDDCWSSLAHARMLRDQGLLAEEDRSAISRGLREILATSREGKFTIPRELEDVHTAIESRLGEPGKRVHLGRSRNDQVLACLRLHAKRKLLELEERASSLALALLELARAHERWPLPGYTHLRRAMPSSVGLWAAGFAELVTDDLELLAQARLAQDRSPLGSAAGFGVPLPLDRARTARLLGFARVQTNVQAVQSSRGKAEAHALFACVELGHTLAKLSWDLELYSAPEFGFVRLAGDVATGSSIMPQKRNPDVLELTRANAAVLESFLQRILSVAGRLPSSYHRDYQVTKEPLVKGLELTIRMTRAMETVVTGLSFDRAACDAAVTDETFSAHRAFELAAQGVPFRDAYKQTADELARGEVRRPADLGPVLAAYRVEGAAGDLRLDEAKSRLDTARKQTRAARAALDSALAALEQDRA